MKILITGASGQLGTEIQRQLKNGGSALGPVPERLKNATVIATDVAELDITDRDATIAFVRRHQPDTIISCAAFTNVDGCETNPEAAFKVNAIGASNLAQAAERINARLIHVSTDYVFRGEGNKPLDESERVDSCAAFTNVDGCETNPEAAFKVNAIGASNLAQAAERINARLIHVSTDYVFRGEGNKPLDESERVDPKSVYGKTKALGEEYVKNFCHRYFIVRTAWLYGYAGKNFVKTIVNAGNRYFIVRTAWLYGYAGKNFVKTIVNAGKKFGKLEVVSDQLGNPTNAEDLAHHILQLAVSHDYGVYHCTGEGVCSWYEFASEIIRLSGVDATVAPCTSAEYSAKHPAAADRPAWSALENRMLACEFASEIIRLSGVDATVAPCTSAEYSAKHPAAADRPAWSALENRMLACTVGNHMRDWKEALADFFAHWNGE